MKNINFIRLFSAKQICKDDNYNQKQTLIEKKRTPLQNEIDILI
jgi:hypothetical protein